MKNIIKKILSVAFVFGLFLTMGSSTAYAVAPTVVSFGANPSTVAYGGDSTITWTSSNASSCTGTLGGATGWAGAHGFSGSFPVLNLTQTTTFGLYCSNTAGQNSSTIFITITVNNIPPPANPTAQISAYPTSVTSGGSTNLSWSSTNANTCTATSSPTNSQWSGTKNTSGSQGITNLNVTTTFSITCTNTTTNAQASAYVQVYVTTPPPQGSAPVVTVSINPNSITAGGSATLSWSATNNPTSCYGSWGNWAGPVATTGNQSVSPSVTTTYNISCTNAYGTGNGSATLTVTQLPPPPAQAPTVNLTANPTSVVYGGATGLSWSVTNATSCTANSSPVTTWTGSKSAFGGSQIISNLTTTTYFNITCSGAGGTASDTVSVSVASQPTPVPTVNVTASPTSVAYNGSTTVSWSSTNSTSCVASGNGWSGTKATSGSLYFANLTSNTSYTLTCTGNGGTATDTAYVTVGNQPPTPQVPTVNITANPSSVSYGTASTLSWTSTNSIYCNATGGINNWSGPKNTTGYFPTGNLNNTVTYTITCTGNGGSATDSVTVLVNAQPTPIPTVNLTANPTNVSYNGNTVLSWTVTNATFCTASGGWSGNTSDTSGSYVVNGLTSSTSFTLTCTNATGSASDSASVTVSGQPNNTVTVNITASPTTVAYNGNSTLSWNSTNALSCNATNGVNGWAGAKNTNGTFPTGTLTTNTTYTITCGGVNGGYATDTVTVFVDGQPNTNLPIVTTNAVNSVGTTYATLNGFVNANGGSNVSAWFEWGTNGGYGNTTPQNNYGSTSGTSYSYVLTGLQSNTAYYYRAVAQNANGQVVYGNQMSFTTTGTPYIPPYNPPYNPCGIFNSSCTPTAVTTLATNLGQTSARLNGLGLVTNNVVTTGYFEWGTTQFLGNTTVSTTIGSSSSNPYFNSVFGLSPNTTYFYRAVVTNQYGTSRGDIVSFRTNPVNTVINTGTNTNVITRTNVVYRDVVVNTNTNTNLVAGVSKPSLVFLGVNCNNQVLVPGEIFECVVNWKNVSNKNLSDVLLRVGFPKELTFLQASRGYFSEVDNAVIIEIVNLAPGEEGSMVFTTRVRTDAQLGKVVVVAGSLVYSYTGDNGAYAQEEVFAYSNHTIQGGLQLQGAAVLGASYLPSSLLGWLILILIILLIILLARMAYNSTRPHTVIIPDNKDHA